MEVLKTYKNKNMSVFCFGKFSNFSKKRSIFVGSNQTHRSIKHIPGTALSWETDTKGMPRQGRKEASKQASNGKCRTDRQHKAHTWRRTAFFSGKALTPLSCHIESMRPKLRHWQKGRPDNNTKRIKGVLICSAAEHVDAKWKCLQTRIDGPPYPKPQAHAFVTCVLCVL